VHKVGFFYKNILVVDKGVRKNSLS